MSNVYSADRVETSSSSWGSDAEDLSALGPNSVWTLTFQGPDDGIADFADDSTDFQSSTDYDQTHAAAATSADQSGASEPAWLKPWSPTAPSLARNVAQTRANHDQASTPLPSERPHEATSGSTFRLQPMSDEHKTAILGWPYLFSHTAHV